MAQNPPCWCESVKIQLKKLINLLKRLGQINRCLAVGYRGVVQPQCYLK